MYQVIMMYNKFDQKYLKCSRISRRTLVFTINEKALFSSISSTEMFDMSIF